MKLAPCNKHKGDMNLICFKIRHDNGDEATHEEIWDEISSQKRRADILAATIRDLQKVVTSDCESKDEFITQIRNVLGADPDLRVVPNVEVSGRPHLDTIKDK